MPASDTQGPTPLGPNGEIIRFARGRVAVGVPQNWTGGRPQALAQLRNRYEQVGEPLAAAILVKGLGGRPDEATREDIRRTFDEMTPMLVCQSMTILDSGFLASGLISIVSQILRLTRKEGRNYRIHSNLESTAAWIHEQLDDPNASVEEILETLRWAASHPLGPI